MNANRREFMLVIRVNLRLFAVLHRSQIVNLIRDCPFNFKIFAQTVLFKRVSMTNKCKPHIFTVCVAVFATAIGTIGCTPPESGFAQSKASDTETSDADTREQMATLKVEAINKFRQGKFDEAIEVLQSQENPNDSEAKELPLAMAFLLGEFYFANGQPEESALVFDRVLKRQPAIKPQLWQRGLALYYADRFSDGVDQFESHQTFNSQDVENAVWHMLCKAKISSVDEARKALIPIERDRRVPMPEVYELFAGRGSVESVIQAAEASGRPGAIYHGLLYVGLFHEMMGETEQSKAAIEKAVAVNPFEKTSFMGNVAATHAAVRKYETQP